MGFLDLTGWNRWCLRNEKGVMMQAAGILPERTSSPLVFLNPFDCVENSERVIGLNQVDSPSDGLFLLIHRNK